MPTNIRPNTPVLTPNTIAAERAPSGADAATTAPSPLVTPEPPLSGALPSGSSASPVNATNAATNLGNLTGHSSPSVVGVVAGAGGALDATGATLASADAGEFQPSKLKEYAFYKAFWSSGNADDGTAHDGLDEVTVAGVDTLYNFAMNHNLDGSPSAAGQKSITNAERALVQAILENPDVGTFFELDALPALYSKFGMAADTVHSVAETAAATKIAFAKALGMSASKLDLSFPKAGRNAEMTYFAMNGKMAEPMSFVDQYRDALGLEKSAEAFEKAPVLGWMVGETQGHTKHGNFDEKKPFSTSGVNWGPLIFPGNSQVANLPAKKGFDFPIDALSGFNRAVGAYESEGDKIEVVDAGGNALKAEVVIHKGADGKAESWSAVFKDSSGKVISPDKVTGLIKDEFGEVKGDGETVGKMRMGWWGFCDRNTAGTLYKSKFEIPNLDRNARIEVNGKIITVPKGDAQKLLDVDMTDMAGPTRFVGHRFDDAPMQIRLSNGETLRGKVPGFELRMGPNAERFGGDNIRIRNSSSEPFLGCVAIESSWGSRRNISLEMVESITKTAGSDKVTITLKNGREESGPLLSSLSFANAKTLSNGDQVLKNSKAKPILGEFEIELAGGKKRTVKASEIKQMQGELQTEMSISEYVKFISDNKGMYATDNAKGVIVSNGMRWINKIDVTTVKAGEDPSWLEKGNPVYGTKGELKRQAGDQIMDVKGLYKHSATSSFSKQFTGWIQVDKQGKILNEGFHQGEPDFGWAADNALDWNAESSFNPSMVPEMRLKLFINGMSDESALNSMAKRLNFPANWKSLRTPDAD